MNYPNRDGDRPLRTRLAWAGCGLTRMPVRATARGAVRESLLARLLGRALTHALMPWQRLSASWPAAAMELALRLWPAPGSESRKANASAGAATVVWKVVERSLGTEHSLAAPQRVMREGMADKGSFASAAETSTRSDLRALPGYARERFDWRQPSVRIDRLVRPGALRLVSTLAPVAPAYLQTPGVSSETGDANPQTPHVRRDVSPEFFAKPELAPAPEPSAIEQLFSNSERAMLAGAFTFRVLPPEAPPVPPQALGPAGPWYTAPAQSQPAIGTHARSSRAEIDLLTSRVMAQIRREQRLERESRGLL